MTARADDPVGSAQRVLASLNQQADALRERLAAMQAALEGVQRDFDATRAAQLQQANEKLVVAALRAQDDAEAARAERLEGLRLSQRDPLTGMPNRAVMADRLESALAMARRRGTHLALMFVDLDRFKDINDRCGHAAGDAVLQEVARRIESAVRESDTVSRHGGDEFLVLLPEVSQVDDVEVIAEKIRRAVDAIMKIGEHAFRVSASVGYALYPQDGTDAASLLALADARMYRLKHEGRHPPSPVQELPSGRSRAALASQLAGVPGASGSSAPATHGRPVRVIELREANERLVVAAMKAQEAAEQLELAQRQHFGFIATVAHEMRSPLSPIRTGANLLARLDAAEPLIGRISAIIDRQVTRLARLVEDLLDAARINSHCRFTLELGKVDLTAVLRLAVEGCQPAFEARRQHLGVTLPDEALVVVGDQTRLVQVFVNLLENASRYTAEQGRITVVAVRGAGGATVTVADNGIGIDAKALPYIFDLFVQGPDEPTTHRSGLGIGLAVVRELVQAHGGTVTVSSAGRGQGSRFVVTLPLA